MDTANSLRQNGVVGPWKPAFFLSIFMLVLTLSVIYWNENKEGEKFCQAPNFTDSPLVVITVGATVGHFVVQLSGAYSKYGSNKHTSASMMVLLMTGIQAASQSAMMSNVLKTTCEDYFGIRTSMFLWVEWMSTVPIMFYLTTIMDVNKFQLTKEDQLVIAGSTIGLFCLYLLSFGIGSAYIAIFLIFMANLLMMSALFWLHGSSYFAHMATVIKAKKFVEDSGPLMDLYIEVKARKLLCAGFMNYFFTLFPVAYYLKSINVIDHDTFYITFGILNFVCKGIFSALVTDSHSELLDPRTFLLFSEKERMENNRRTFMRYVANEVQVPMKSLTLSLKLLNASSDLSSADKGTATMVADASELLTEALNDALEINAEQKEVITIVKKPIHIMDIVMQAKDVYQRQISAKNLQVTFSVGRDVPYMVLGDMQRLDQVMAQLLRNAIRCSESDGTVAVNISYGTHVRGAVTFSIVDEGYGMPETARESLLYTLAQIKQMKEAGTEAGPDSLSVVAEIVALHGGSIGCDSYSMENKTGNLVTRSEVYFSIIFELAEEDDEEDDVVADVDGDSIGEGGESEGYEAFTHGKEK